jgi:hypothetical protein
MIADEFLSPMTYFILIKTTLNERSRAEIISANKICVIHMSEGTEESFFGIK